jgi:hypothetical protein
MINLSIVLIISLLIKLHSFTCFMQTTYMLYANHLHALCKSIHIYLIILLEAKVLVDILSLVGSEEASWKCAKGATTPSHPNAPITSIQLPCDNYVPMSTPCVYRSPGLAILSLFDTPLRGRSTKRPQSLHQTVSSHRIELCWCLDVLPGFTNQLSTR